METKIDTVSHNVDKQEKYAADLEHALSVAGTGYYNLKYCFVLALILIAAILEMIGYSVILPAAVCDLKMSDTQRGFVGSVPFIGILLTSYPWGYLVDTRGRKKAVIYSSLIAGFFSILSALMPELISFAACKFLTSLCVACSSSVPFTFIGEIVPLKSRDITLSVLNALQITGSSLVPLLAWAVIPLEFRIDFGAYEFRSWRLLIILYSLLFIIAAFMLSFGPESPKYLVSQGNIDEALEVLGKIYAGNKFKKPEDYPIKSLIVPPEVRKKGSFLTSLKAQTIPLLKWEYLKWMLLNGFLFFGLFSIVNGLYIWVPDVLNRVLAGSEKGKTACQVINSKLNQTTIKYECDDSIDKTTLIINSVAMLCCSMVAIIASAIVKYIGKKKLLIICFLIIGSFCISINITTNDKLFAVFMSSFPILVICMGPVNAFAVEIFPTHLRGMAISLSFMLGRLGSIAGTNVVGLMINNACVSMFYYFGSLLLLCGVLSFIFPNSSASSKKLVDITSRQDRRTVCMYLRAIFNITSVKTRSRRLEQ